MFALTWIAKTKLALAQTPSQQFTLTTKYHPDFFDTKAFPAILGLMSLIEKAWPRPGVIDESSHLHNEIQIQAEINNIMKGKRLVKINVF